MTSTQFTSRDNFLWTLVAASAPIVWGTTYVVTSQLLPAGFPFWSSVLRALPGGILGLLICRSLPEGVWIIRSVILSVLNIGIWFPLLFLAAYRLPGGIASVLAACQPLFVITFAWLLTAQSPTFWRIGWAVCGVFGIAIMVLAPGASLDWVGIAAGIVGTASMALGIVLTKRWGRPTDAFTWTFWLLSWSGLILIPIAFLLEGNPPALTSTSLMGYLWLSLVGGLLTYWAWFSGLAKVSAVSAGFLPLLSPLVATLLGLVILGESLSTVQWLGFLLCLCTILLSQLQPSQFLSFLKFKDSSS